VTIVPDGRLAYGMQLPIQAQSALFAADWEQAAGADELIRLARTADEAGFLYVAVCDHVAVPERLAAGMSTTWYDTVATLGLLAGVTRRVHLLSHVWVLAYRHPLQSAKSFATLDHLSKGRVIAGVGAGHVEEEFTMLGLDFHQRGRLLDEAMDAFATALTDEFPSFAGDRWSFSGMGVGPRPAERSGRSRPPIWVGGSSPAAIRRAAERGDGWLPQGTPRSKMPEQIEQLRQHRDKARDGEPIDIGTITEFLYVGAPAWDVGRNVISGPPEPMAASLREFGAMGVTNLQVRFKARSCDELVDQMTAFGRDVAPLLND
jgi:probable F420-dependent oxidoreductase